MAAGMDKLVTKLTRREVVAAHWALWEKPEECNAHIREWFENVVFGRESKL
jgi:soluble epoxide hydrolase/lipid-phosphate phosphatase